MSTEKTTSPFEVQSEGNVESSGRRTRLDFDHVLSFRPADTTPLVSNLTRFKAADDILTITNFDGGQQGQRIHILGDDKTTVEDNTTIKRAAGTSILQLDRIYSFEYIDGIWYEDAGAGATSGARVYQSAPQTIPDSAPTQIPFNLERYDDENYHDPGLLSTRITIPHAGRYHVGASVVWSPSAVGSRTIELWVNAGLYVIARNDSENVGGGGLAVLAQFAVTDWEFAQGDYIEVFVTQTSGGPLAINSFEQVSPEFWIHSLGAGGGSGGGGGGSVAPHHTTHEDGGSDEISVTGLSGLLADPQTPLAHTHPLSDITQSGASVDDVPIWSGSVWVPGPQSGGASTMAWMPLTTVVAGEPELVWDADDSLIPTLVPV
jgi:hypothetical protein